MRDERQENEEGGKSTLFRDKIKQTDKDDNLSSLRHESEEKEQDNLSALRQECEKLIIIVIVMIPLNYILMKCTGIN